jgi:hypothetical protein
MNRWWVNCPSNWWPKFIWKRISKLVTFEGPMQVQEQPWAGQDRQEDMVQDRVLESNHHPLCACACLRQSPRWGPPSLLSTPLSTIRRRPTKPLAHKNPEVEHQKLPYAYEAKTSIGNPVVKPRNSDYEVQIPLFTNKFFLAISARNTEFVSASKTKFWLHTDRIKLGNTF